MFDALQLNPKLISILDDSSFVRLCNDLIRAEADLYGLSQSGIYTNRRKDDPDGGIDAYIRDIGVTDSQWLPPNASAWQYKSGRCPPVETLKKKEFIKSGVLATIQNGDAYVFVTAADLTPKKAKSIEDALSDIYDRYGKTPRARVYYASMLAEWVKNHPGILVTQFRVPIRGWWSYEKWGPAKSLVNPFEPDPQRSGLIRQIQDAMVRRQHVVRIIGHSGVGKTRTVFEALKGEGRHQRVLYCPDAANISSNDLWDLQHYIPQGSGVLVIDECTAEEFRKLESGIKALPSPFTVIAIGPNEYQPQSGVLEMGRMDDDTLAKVIGGIVHNLPEPTRQAIAKRCNGSPKLAVLISQRIIETGGLRNWRDIESSDGVAAYFYMNLFPYAKDETSPQAKLMRGISLFTRIGWRDDVKDEFQLVIEFAGLSEPDANGAVDQLERCGLISRRGRYLYPTPDVLANHLTRRTLEGVFRQSVLRLSKRLEGGMSLAFANRMRQLGDDPETREVVYTIFGATGFFHNLSEINSRQSSELFRLLVPAFPKLLLDQLEVLLSSASQQELKALDIGRRNIIWALEELAWHSDYFERVAWLLLILATAENESYANNATGVWTRLFQIALSGTSAAYSIRLPVLKRAMASPDRSVRLLAVKALGSGLETNYFVGTSGPSPDLPQLPPKEWGPETFQDISDVLNQLAPLLKQALSDMDPEVRQAAREVLWQHGDDFANVRLLQQWEALASQQADAPFEQRLLGIRMTKYLHLNKSISPDDKKRLTQLRSQLIGPGFGDRLRYVTTTWSDDDYTEEEGTLASVVSGLVNEALEQPELLFADRDWLLSGRANSGYTFGFALGQQDNGLEFMDRITSMWKGESEDVRFVAGYLAGVVEHEGNEWLEMQLEAWVQDPSRCPLVAQVIWRVGRAPATVHLLIKLIQNGSIPGSFIGNLALGFWTRGLNALSLKQLLRASESDSSWEARSGRLVVLAQYLPEYPDRFDILHEEVFWVLKDGIGTAGSTMNDYEWAQLAKLVVTRDPVGIAQSAVDILKTSNSGVSDVNDVLDRAIEVGGWQVFTDVIGPELLANPLGFWRVEGLFGEHSLLGKFEPAKLVEWVEQDEKTRLPIVTHATSVSGGQLSPLARSLLVRWGVKKVGGALAGRAVSGTFWGSYAQQILKWLPNIEAYRNDPEPNVRAWANQLTSDLRREYEQQRIEEEEE